MATLQDAADMAQDPRLFAPLTAGVVKAAVNVINEDEETENHEPRVNLARRVLMEPELHARRFQWAVPTNATVLAKWAADDIEGALGDLQFVVNSLWDAFASLPG